VKNITNKTKLILAAYLYEIQVNVFVGTINFKLSEEILVYLKEKTKGREQSVFIKECKKTYEGFDVQYINCPKRYIDFDGLKFFK
jgi:CRISPR-associated endoribonuclease Cas2 subtype I-E